MREKEVYSQSDKVEEKLKTEEHRGMARNKAEGIKRAILESEGGRFLFLETAL